MLEEFHFETTVTKEEFKKEARARGASLASLQQDIRRQKIPVIILFEGWGAAGKGGPISKLILNFDPRGSRVISFQPPTALERREPFLWRYWKEVPASGEIEVLDRSWYQEISTLALEEDIDEAEIRRRTESIRIFERQLADGGYLIIKFFMHISRKEQKKRFDELTAVKDTAWRVTGRDWEQNRHYHRYLRAFDRMLERTGTDRAPWHIVSGADRSAALLKIYRVVEESVRGALIEKERKRLTPPAAPEDLRPAGFRLLHAPKSADYDLTQTVSEEKYRKELDRLHAELRVLHNRIYRKKIPVILAYEGWDAAGKGGSIRRVAAALDPRGYEVNSIAAPTGTELAHHYLWRFWTRLPRDGHIAIFDRTWYGRVLVERVEGFSTAEEWGRAYREINEFERELANWGAVIVKYWLQIDQDEQLLRFTARQNTPEKQWKITEEDWRNREKWPQYEAALNDMLRYTSTDFAPWHVVESQDKRFGRLKALRILINAIRERL